MSENCLIQELVKYPNWVMWQKVQAGTDKEGKPKFTKLPFIADTRNARPVHAKSNDPSTWRSYPDAFNAWITGQCSGVGFVLTSDLPYICIDLDHCVDSATGEMKEPAATIVAMIRQAGGTYIEFSPSGEGLHIWGKASLPSEKKGLRSNGIEIYQDGRYMTVTGDAVDNAPIADIQGVVNDIIEKYDLLKEKTAPVATPSIREKKKIVTNETRTAGSVAFDDAFLIEKIRRSKESPKFTALFDYGDISGYEDDASRADEGLLSILAFWTNGNAAQMESIFMKSALAANLDRKKHHDNGYLRKYSIPKALALWEEKGRPHYEPNIFSSLRASDNGQASQWNQASNESYEEAAKSTTGEIAVILNPELLTDYTLAELTVRKYGDRLKYCVDLKTWVMYNGKYWQAIDKEEAYSHVVKIIEFIKREITQAMNQVEGDGERAKVLAALFRQAVDRRNNKHLRDVVTVMQGMNTCHAIDFDRDPYVLNCANGLLDLKTGQLFPHAPSQMCMKCTGVAYTGPSHSSLWRDTVAAILPNEKTRHYMQKVLGYAICGDVREHESYFLKGNGGNGKSLIMETVAAVLGSYSITIPIETLLSNGFDESGNNATPVVASLRGKRLAICGESELGRSLNAAAFKKLTGGDTLTARGLYQGLISFTPSHHLFFTSNYDIALKDAADGGLKRRLKVVTFPVTFSEEAGNIDKGLYAKLRERKSQENILTWLVEGFRAYQAEGLKEPPQVKADTQGYYDENDTIGDFIRECCELGPEKRINRVDLYKDYCQYYQNECGRFPMSAKAFYQIVQRRQGVGMRKINGVRYFMGIDRKMKPITE